MDELKQSIDIEAPIEEVWAELTRTSRVQRAMLNSVLESELKPDSPIKYSSPDGKRVFVVGRVVDIDPPRLLSHTYLMTMREDPLTLVTWRLEPTMSGTRVTLIHAGWTPEAKKVDKVDKTWAGILRELKNVVEQGDVSTRTRLTYSMMRTFMFMMPSKTKAENAQIPAADARWGQDGLRETPKL